MEKLSHKQFSILADMSIDEKVFIDRLFKGGSSTFKMLWV